MQKCDHIQSSSLDSMTATYYCGYCKGNIPEEYFRLLPKIIEKDNLLSRIIKIYGKPKQNPVAKRD